MGMHGFSEMYLRESLSSPCIVVMGYPSIFLPGQRQDPNVNPWYSVAIDKYMGSGGETIFEICGSRT